MILQLASDPSRTLIDRAPIGDLLHIRPNLVDHYLFSKLEKIP